MTRPSFLRWLLAPARPASKPARRSRLAVESLEVREVPAAFTVTTLADENDGIDVGGVSLREAITAANSQAGDDTIDFAVTGTINLGGALPELASNIAVNGPGADRLTVRRGTWDNYGVFSVNAGAASLSGLTVSNGNTSALGGGVYNSPGSTLTLIDCTVSGNQSYRGDGGGIFNAGTLTMTNCTVSGNRTVLSFGDGIAVGGGGGVANRGTLSMTNCTLSGNMTSSYGGAVLAVTGRLTMTNCTVTDNRAAADGAFGTGGGLYVDPHVFGNAPVLRNTIVAGNYDYTPTFPDDTRGLVAAQFSLIQDFRDTTFTADSGSNLIGVDPQLGPLQDNGGSTPTCALSAGSPAINAGSNALIPDGVTTDQRGLARVSGGAVDMGAFEVQLASAPTLTTPAEVTAFEDVDQAVPGIAVGDADGGGDALTVTLATGLGTLTVGTTTNLTVSGDGSGVVTLSGSAADLNAALATLNYRGAVNFAGSDWLNVTVGDGRLSTSGSVTIHVKSAAEQAADLRALVAEMRSDGELTGGQATALTAKLSLQGNTGDVGKVQAFLSQVQAFLNAGILTPAEADALTGPGRILLLSLTRQ